MTALLQSNRARLEADGFGKQYLDGYMRTNAIDRYTEDTLVSCAWRAGYEDWLQDVASGSIATASVEDLSREFAIDLGDFVDVSVGAATWVNAAGKFYIEADYKVCGEIWRVHKSDADPYPSNPHAHCVGGAKGILGCTLHLGTRELYRKRNALGRFLDSEQFNRLIELILPKFPGISLPLKP